MSIKTETEEAIYWAIRAGAEGLALNALEWGLNPADILDALNMGLENATTKYREYRDRIEAGH